MGQADFYKHGDSNCLCDRCGAKNKGSSLKSTWDGLLVCRKCWEPRQPQDFVRGKADNMLPPALRPEPPDTFI